MFCVARAVASKPQRYSYSKTCSKGPKAKTVPPPVKNPKIQFTDIFINNEWHKSKSGKTFKTTNPTTEKVIAEVQQGAAADIDVAVCAACEAFELTSTWRTMKASERGRLLYKLADLIEKHSAYLASLETLDNGKPYKAAYQVDIKTCKDVLRYMAGWADKNCGRTIPVDASRYFSYTRHEPVGVCGQIIPWNFPLTMLIKKIAPALSMGNTVVVKPAEQTPLTSLYVAHLAKEAGFPPGVLNVVPGFGDAGAALVSHKEVAKIAFTGSTAVGLKILQGAGTDNLKRTTLELGGKSPLIVLADANLDEAVEIAHQALFYNQGQVCCAGTRTFIEHSIYDKFVKKSVERAKKRIVGDPFDMKTEQGPQIDGKHMKKILGLIDSGVKDGAKLLTGGKRKGDKGFFVEPTVFAGVEDHHSIARDEIFGPVQQLMKFEDLDELLERANNTDYGLASSVISNNMNKINYIVEGIQAGIVWVNCYNISGPQQPFGGFKNSGIGREMGEYGIQAYTEIKNVVMKLPRHN